MQLAITGNTSVQEILYLFWIKIQILYTETKTEHPITGFHLVLLTHWNLWGYDEPDM
jgi:hypothetical protein